jgi:hypothetical protein
MARYSKLAPLSVSEKIGITKHVLAFFDPINNRKYRELLGMPIEPPRAIPLSMADFFEFYKIGGIDYLPRLVRINELVNLLCVKGALSSLGDNRYRSSMIELTEIEKKGHLYLGKYLGPEIIADQIGLNLAYITGITLEKGDPAVGSGILLKDNLVLTCAHVLTEMRVNSSLEINHKEYEILRCEPHPNPKFDVGFIILKDVVTDNFHHDIALRSSSLLEEIVIAGFPRIPLNLNEKRNPIVQRGEIASRISTYNPSGELELFTAVARPGNSGGPLLSLEGKVLGIVTKSLEQQAKEVSDLGMAHLPFFASIPSDIIMKSFNELPIAKEFSLPWENFE